jgi:hypothetical protein
VQANRVGFTVAHQYLHQLEPDVRHAVLGNTGSIISFRVGAEDAPYPIREFNGRFEEIDLLQLPNYHIYIKLMIDGTPSTPFSALTLSHADLSSGYRTAAPSDSPRLDVQDWYD